MPSLLRTAARLQDLTEKDLEQVLQMRNHPEIRRYMLTNSEITTQEHQLWFERASKDPSIKLLTFYLGDICSGFVQLKKTASPKIANWGFYVNPNAPKGAGTVLGISALTHAFEILNLHKLCGQALAPNDASKRLHTKLGFRQEGIAREQHFDGQTFQDLICFGILKDEWTVAKHHLEDAS